MRMWPPRAPAIVTAVLTLALLPGTPAASAPRSRHVDLQWTSPDFGRAGVRTIAILPAVTFDGNTQAANGASAVWAAVFPDSGYTWIPADEVLRRLERARRLAMLQSPANPEIRRSGRVAPATARTLCQSLDAQALLCLRVDKWEAAVAPDARHTASIEIHCALVDSSGAELWRLSGRSMYRGAAQTSPITFEAPAQSPAASVPRAVSRPVSSATGGGVSGGSSGGGSSGGSGGGSSGGGGGSHASSGGGGSPSPAASTGMPSSSEFGGASARGIWESRSLPASDTPAEFRSALAELFADWVPLLPAPGGGRK